MTTKTTTIQTLYVDVALNSVIFPQILYIVPFAQQVLPVEFFLKYYFNKLRIQLPQNITWNDE